MNTALHVTRAVANGFLLAGPRGRSANKARAVAGATSGLVSLALSPIDRYGSDGADQATYLTQTTNAAARLLSDDVSKDAVFWFQSLQCTASYAIAGVAKLFGRPWRDGTAVRDILRTRTYGHERLWKLMDENPWFAKAANYSVLMWECSFPLVYVAPKPISRLIASSGIMFHLVNGPAMGLWRFAFAFGSLHPALGYTAEGNPRPEALKVVGVSTAIGTATLMGVSVAVSTQRRQRLVSHVESSVQVETRSGARLPVDVSDDTGSGPVALFDSGLLGMPDQFHWIRKELERAGYTTASYIRHEYLPAGLRTATRHGIDESARDLVDVTRRVQEIAGGRPVLLVGHSFGGELVRRAMQALSDSACGAVLIDPTHPNQFQSSAFQETSKSGFTDHLVTFRSLIKAGFGGFLTRPAWMNALPEDASDRAFTQYADTALWDGGMAEWSDVVRSLPSHGDAPIPVTPIRGKVISAGRTLDADSALRDLHDELTTGETTVLDDVTHESILSSREHSKRAAAEIIAYIEEASSGGSG